MSRSARNRLAQKSWTRPVLEPSTRPTKHLPPVTVVDPCGAGIRRTRVSYAGSGVDGYRSEWAISQSYSTRVTRDARWSNTSSTNRAAR